MADYILRADSPSQYIGGKVYLTEDNKWTPNKMGAKIFTAKTRATEAKKEATISCEIIQPDFETNAPVETAL